MKIIRVDEEYINTLVQYRLHKDIKNQEAIFYVYNNDYLLKLFKSNDFMTLNNKMYILNKLFYIKKYVDIEEIVWPNDLVKVGNINRGFIMNFIKYNSNVGLIFNSDKVSIEDKLFFLKSIGNILKKLENNDSLKSIDFHLSDIHEGNFIYDSKNNNVKIIDIDSSYVEGAIPSISKFLYRNDKLWDFPNKYPLDENNIHIPSKNTTILSFVYILLNFITGYYSPDMTTHDFSETLNILNNIGVNKELLDSIFNVYSTEDNYFDYGLLECITPDVINKYKELSLKNH